MCKNKPLSSALICNGLILLLSQPLQAATDYGIQTLFTTPQERALIDHNRYRVAVKKTAARVETVAPKAPKKIEMETVTLTIKLNGVTFGESGQSIAWLNGASYENGDKLEDGTRVFISKQATNQVQVKTPDGKYHRLVAGESNEIQYQKAIEG